MGVRLRKVWSAWNGAFNEDWRRGGEVGGVGYGRCLEGGLEEEGGSKLGRGAGLDEWK